MKNRAFFFGDFEGTRVRRVCSRLSRVATTSERNGSSRPIRDPRTASRLPTTRFPPITSIHRARSSRSAEPIPRKPTISPASRMSWTTATGIRRERLRVGTERQLFARYIYADRFPVRAGQPRRGTRRNLFLLAGRRHFFKSHRAGGRVDPGPRSEHWSTRSACRGREASPTAQQDPFGQNGMAQIGFQGVPEDPLVAGGIIGIDIPRLQPPRVSELHAQVPAHRSDAVSRTRDVAARATTGKFGADMMMPMNNEYVDIPSTRGNLFSSHGAVLPRRTPSPTSCSATCAARSCRTSTSSTSAASRRRSSSRTTGAPTDS